MSWKLTENIEGAIRDLEVMAEKATQKSAKRVIARAKVPVRTGHLRDSAYVDAEPSVVDGHTATGMGYEAEYASLVHDGYQPENKPFVGARPFLKNSLAADEDNLDDDVAAGLIKLGCSRVDRY